MDQENVNDKVDPIEQAARDKWLKLYPNPWLGPCMEKDVNNWEFYLRGFRDGAEQYSGRWSDNLNIALNAIDAIDCMVGVAGVHPMEVDKTVERCKEALDNLRKQTKQHGQK